MGKRPESSAATVVTGASQGELERLTSDSDRGFPNRDMAQTVPANEGIWQSVT